MTDSVDLQDETARVGRSRRRQFGLKHLLLLTLLAAVSVVLWKKFLYVHPAHRNISYERAPYSRSGQVVFGDCRIRLESVARNDRSGAIQVEDGFGNTVTAAASNRMALKNSGPWLDAAQIELSASGGSFEVLDSRVFDFETRQLIDKIQLRSGDRMVGPETLEFYRLGSKLPDVVDVFLRVRVYGSNNKPTILQPQAGATCKLPGGTLEIDELYPGMQSYTPATGVVSDPGEANSEVAVMLKFNGEWPYGSKYHIVAVGKDGTRVHVDSYLRFPGGYLLKPDASWDDGEKGELKTLPMGLADVAHFELRPLDGQHVFFFEGVQLPVTSAARFTLPPVATVKIGGVETTVKVPEFEPLDVRVTTMKGDAVSGSSGNNRVMNVTLRAGGPLDPETKTTIVDSVKGLSKADSILVANPGAGQKKASQSGSMWGGGRYLRYSVVPLPIEDVDSVQVQLPAP